MIAAAVRCRLRARPVGADLQLAYGGYVYLEYSSDAPYEVRLVQSGPYRGVVTFARDLLLAALEGRPNGAGDVRARLAYVPAARHTMLLVAIDGQDGGWEIALIDAAVAAFLEDTEDLVPVGEESGHLPDLDAGLDRLLQGGMTA